MNIGYRTIVTEYINVIENIPNMIDISMYNNIESNIEDLINQILNYVHENFPAILIAKDELEEKIKNIYIQKTGTLKKDVEFRTATIKYDLNGTYSLKKIQEYMEKGNKDLTICFKSISFGTNVSYKDTVTNISGEIFGILQRKSNNNLIFAKKTRETQEYIDEKALKHYMKFMNEFGNELIKKGIEPLEVYLEKIKNYEETPNNEIIDNYMTA